MAVAGAVPVYTTVTETIQRTVLVVAVAAAVAGTIYRIFPVAVKVAETWTFLPSPRMPHLLRCLQACLPAVAFSAASS